MDTRTAMQTALKVRGTRPTSGEGDIAVAAWRRCLYAFLDNATMCPDDRRAFLNIVGEDTPA